MDIKDSFDEFMCCLSEINDKLEWLEQLHQQLEPTPKTTAERKRDFLERAAIAAMQGMHAAMQPNTPYDDISITHNAVEAAQELWNVLEEQENDDGK